MQCRKKLAIISLRSVALKNGAANFSASNHYKCIAEEQNTVSDIPPSRVSFAHLMVSAKLNCGHNITRHDREVTFSTATAKFCSHASLNFMNTKYVNTLHCV